MDDVRSGQSRAMGVYAFDSDLTMTSVRGKWWIGRQTSVRGVYVRGMYLSELRVYQRCK